MIFLCKATQNDHIRLLYKFENDQILVVLGVVDMRQLLLSTLIKLNVALLAIFRTV